MAVVALTRRWRLRPPPGGQINWGHPITRGLVAAYLFNEGAGEIVRNLVDPADALTISNTSGTVWSAGSDGVGLYAPIAGSIPGATLATPSAALKPTSEVSMLWRGIIVGDGQIANNPPLFGMNHNTSSSSPFESYTLNRKNLSQGDLYGLHSAGGSLNIITVSGGISAVPYGTPVGYGFARTDGRTTIYRDGQPIGSDSASGALTYDATAFLSVNRDVPVGGGSCNTISEVGLIWNRELTQQEYLELHENPYCFIVPQRPLKSFDLSGRSDTTLSPSGIASIEAFGAAAVYRAGDIYPVGIGTAEAFGTASIGQSLTISPSSVASAGAFGTPAITDPALSQTLSPSGIGSAEAFGTSLIVRGGTQYCLPAGLTSAGAFGFPSLLQDGPFVRVRVYVAGTNRRLAINPEVTIQKRMGTRANATFRLMCLPGVSPVRPLPEQAVRITENRRILFSGFLNNVDEEVVTGTGYPDRTPFGLYYWDCQAVDLAVIADRRRVDKTYAAGPLRDIILDMAANFLTGENITTNGVLTTASTVAPLAFAKKTFAECMNQATGITGDIWGITELGDLYCYAPGNAPASSFVVTATNATLMPGIKKTTSSIGLATQIFARTDQDLGATDDLSA